MTIDMTTKLINWKNKYSYLLFLAGFLFFFLPSARAINYGEGLYNASLYSATMPSSAVASPAAGTYTATKSVTLTASGSSSIRYSLTSIPADCSSGTLYSTPISVSNSQTIYTRACDNYGNSSTASFAYSIVSESNYSGAMPANSNNPPLIPSGGFQVTVSGNNINSNAGTDVKKMAISLDGNFDNVSLEDYKPAKEIDICAKLNKTYCPDGVYTIYIKFYTASGSASDVVLVKVTKGNQSAILNSSNSTISSASSSEFIANEDKLVKKVNKALTQRLAGRILLQVESQGQAWYVNPLNGAKYYLGTPADAFVVMRKLALGVSNKTFATFKNGKAPAKLAGRILLKVEDNGKAYYVNPVDLKLHYLGRPEDAYTVMRQLGLGINNTNIRQINVSEVK